MVISERLSSAVNRYHTNAVTTAEVIQELIRLARDLRESRRRGEEQGLSADGVAFHDALAENESAVAVLGDERLRVIAHELLTGLKGGVTVDWSQRESARARLRVLVKRVLRRYGYPPACRTPRFRRSSNRPRRCRRRGPFRGSATAFAYVFS